MTQDLQIITEDGVLRLTMQRPETLNAITGEMGDRIAEELEAAVGREDVRAVVLAGAGDAFSSGADISGVDAHEALDEKALDRANRIIRAIVRSEEHTSELQSHVNLVCRLLLEKKKKKKNKNKIQKKST